MTNGTMTAVDNAELEELFDSIAQHVTLPPAGSVGATIVAEGRCGDDSPGRDAAACSAHKVINSVGQLTRKLHDTLAELGYDRQLQECAAAKLPDARQRLAYVVTLTEQAANRSLTAVEAATPVQERLAAEAASLAARWDSVFRGESDVEQFKGIAAETRQYLRAVPEHTAAMREHLREIVVAQEFQDLTGQVLKRITDLAHDLETQLLELLVENASAPARHPEARGRLNGPSITAAADVVANQAQVDELLESLGF